MKQTKNLIIGFGKAGKTLAATFDKHGESTILVEESAQMYGGTCINVGCIPSKKLLFAGKKHDFASAMAQKTALISALRQANFKKVDDLANVEVINATASFVNDHTVELSTGEQITAERIFINTGAVSIMPKIAGIDGKRIYNSTQMLNLGDTQDSHPERLVIVGGGFIALEFAFMYQAFGSKVSIIELNDTLLAKEDDDVREVMQGLLAERGIEVHLGTSVEQFVEQDTHTEVLTNKLTLEADAVLVAIGRRANTDGLKLENTSVQLDERGYVVCNDKLKASDHIWALGDVAGSPQFTYISLDDYRIVVDDLFGSGTRSRNDRQIFPTSVFIEPPLSHIGMTEKQARASGRDYQVAKLPANSVPKAKIVNQTQGFLKAIIDKQTREILGVTLFCENSHEIINLFKLAMDNGIKADYFKSQIFTHPTISEAINDLFGQF
ncbi:pyruvate/2-oxoglutarate dehydrogenase complex dihydrolipoamide dehydrogenase (E3) component [Nicoletella semolina]|uniref:Pyruvate/2-oxoglutarate dehydrogenase complex dihydrolipoamide dehydrogenase (E3) component n=1 Tax=Nicoletella semolina TaxID=271160 RepID=A0A4R2NAL1_9PAST|nr:FAD-dependent oxidoreductase [Nicoletella semolina]MDH2923923.1 pyridine nucleotide-disulfide oxidoreductase [Nicoletella semolina]TCP18044.1 pyruvate/2-oxoglutarate dehydrogenase complex dihydrolipoamide dehydrogenase (E3) component [Nicoletella semolina]